MLNFKRGMLLMRHPPEEVSFTPHHMSFLLQVESFELKIHLLSHLVFALSACISVGI